MFIKSNFPNSKGIFFMAWLTGRVLFMTTIVHYMKQQPLLFTILIIRVQLAL